MTISSVSSFRLRFLQCLCLQLFLLALVRADCYSHDGIRARDSKYYTGPELVSCGKGTNNCCLQGEKCGSNLLCGGSRGNARQYCADPSWAGCSALCPGNEAAGVSLKECPANSNVYCCGTCDCTKNLFFVDPFTGAVSNVTVAPEKAATERPTFWAVDSSAILAGSTSSVAVRTSSIATTSFTPLNSAAPTSGTTPIASTAGSSTASTATSTGDNTAAASSHSSGLSAGASAGIAVGCTLGAVGIAVLAWLFIRERRKRKSIQAQTAPNPVMQQPYDYTTVQTPHKVAYAHAQPNIIPSHQELGGNPRHEMG